MIYLIITTSINNKHCLVNDNHRKNRYIDSIRSVLDLVKDDSSIKSIIVENNGLRKTYLDDLGCDVVYTNNNKMHFTNKGINELMDIHEVIDKYAIKDNDIVIKLTGRYKVLRPDFFTCVKENIETKDAFIKFLNVCTLQFGPTDSVLGLIGIRCKYLRDFKYENKLSPETEIALHVRSSISNDRIVEIHDLYLECCFADDLRIVRV